MGTFAVYFKKNFLTFKTDFYGALVGHSEPQSILFLGGTENGGHTPAKSAGALPTLHYFDKLLTSGFFE